MDMKSGDNRPPREPKGANALRRRRFAELYDGNGVAAARAAGYKGSEATLATQAHRLLRNDEVRRVVLAREVEGNRDGVATRLERQRWWTSVMDDQAADMRDRMRASELLGRSEGDFLDRQETLGTESLAERLSAAIERHKAFVLQRAKEEQADAPKLEENHE